MMLSEAVMERNFSLELGFILNFQHWLAIKTHQGRQSAVSKYDKDRICLDLSLQASC
jgi:hypothetical protein